MYRFRPSYPMYARPFKEYKTKCKQAAAMMVMIQNNLDPKVAQFPHELITYGGNGTVFSNWAQYQLTMKYLSELTEEQTLMMYSGNPMGLFPSNKENPRVVISNGMVIPNYSSKQDYEKMNAMGVTIYGQMTAGSWAYIGPQGIVHGTTLTLMNAGRKYLNTDDLTGKVFVSSGLGAQGKAVVIAGAIGVIAEVDEKALNKRFQQGWIMEVAKTVDEVWEKVKKAKEEKRSTSIAFLGNVVTLWEELAKNPEVEIDLGSDQTSLHNPYNGGRFLLYFQIINDKIDLKIKKKLKAKADILTDPNDFTSFKYPSYVQDIMGPMIFDYGFGPFRWVCTSGLPEDLQKTDDIAAEVCSQLSKEAPKEIAQQYNDNYKWIKQAKENKLVVGSQARILYSDEIGRIKIALAFNQAIKEGKVTAPVVISRDHHDVSGTDSPFRETSNIEDGSKFTADMAIHNVIGDSFRGATWGGFGIVIDGTEECAKRIQSMLMFDVNNGIARRAWAGNQGAIFAIKRAMNNHSKLQVTLPNEVDSKILDDLKF
ncbi:urocanate hydratase [Anaeramoeba ignava]|uniref:Urocanate hydratase n=1 Tax=Anaeramoeba ignava TaxID=1746090 RepID=A0A9Q0L8M2_ANAIG|nr:urocanate hydratase [Anaeramoeba ignava]